MISILIPGSYQVLSLDRHISRPFLAVVGTRVEQKDRVVGLPVTGSSSMEAKASHAMRTATAFKKMTLISLAHFIFSHYDMALTALSPPLSASTVLRASSSSSSSSPRCCSLPLPSAASAAASGLLLPAAPR